MAASVLFPAIAFARTVRVGVYENEPKVFTDADGEPSGIFIDLIREIAKEEGWTLEFVPGTWDEGLQSLKAGRIDLMPDVAFSEDRDAIYDFHATPVVDSWSCVYTGPGVKVENIEDLRNLRVAVLRGSIQETVFNQMVAGFGYDVIAVPVDSFPEAFQLAADRMVDAAVTNQFFGDYFYREYGLTKTPIAFNAVSLYFATAQGENGDLLAGIDRRLNTWIAQPDSPYYRVLSRYTAKRPEPGIPDYVGWIIGVTFALLVAAAALILLLRWQVGAQTRHLTEANAALAGAEETLTLALEAADEGIWDWNPRTGTVVWSPHNYTMLGYNADEFPMSLDAWMGLLHPEDKAAVIDEIWRRIREGDRSFDIEFRMRMKSGDWLWTSGRGRVVALDETGEPARVMGTNTDITERREAAAALAESVSRYRGIFETSPDGIFLLDPGGRIRMANRRAADLVGLEDPESLVGRAFTDWLAPEDRRPFESADLRAPEEHRPTHARATMLARDGSRQPVETVAAATIDDRGTAAGIVVTVRAVSER